MRLEYKGVGCTLDQPLHVVTEASVPAANSGKDSESPGTLLPPALSLAIPRTLGRSKSIPPGWICQHCCWTSLEELKAREAKNSRGGFGREKGRNSFWVPAARAGDRLKALRVDLSAPQAGHSRVLEKERFRRGGGGVRKREGREHVIMGGAVCVRPGSPAGNETTCGVWSSRHSSAIRVFRLWWLGCSGRCKTLSWMPQESVIRNRHYGFQPER